MKLLKQLYQIASPSGKEKQMIEFVKSILDAMPDVVYNIDRYGNIYVTKGSNATYPCIVAHLDEVHQRTATGYSVITLKKTQIILGYDNIHKDFSGIGADDKNGIWVCLKCIEKYKSLKCAFFVDEERGCLGSNKADMDFFKDCRFVLQCDRKGNKDLIVNISGVQLCSDSFIKDINCKKYQYKETSGLMTDVMILKQRKLQVSCVNISCGYYNPHTSNEFTFIPDLYKCLDFVCHIIEDCTKVYRHTYIKSRLGRNRYCNCHFEEDKLTYSNAYDRQFLQMYSAMKSMLTEKPSLQMEDVLKQLFLKYPLLNYIDFKVAYNKITGSAIERK